MMRDVNNNTRNVKKVTLIHNWFSNAIKSFEEWYLKNPNHHHHWWNLSYAQPQRISSVSKSCFINIRDLRPIRNVIGHTAASTIATSLIHSKIGYCNCLLLNLPATQITVFNLFSILLPVRHSNSKISSYHSYSQISSLAYIKSVNSIQCFLSHSQISQNWSSFLTPLSSLAPFTSLHISYHCG